MSERVNCTLASNRYPQTIENVNRYPQTMENVNRYPQTMENVKTMYPDKRYTYKDVNMM